MVSVISICNTALSRLGQTDPITALSEASEAARQCNLLFEQSRDAVLREFPWAFANRTALLALRTDSYPGFNYAYGYPSDCLVVRKIYEEAAAGGDPCPYKIVLASDGARAILTDAETAYIDYTGRVIDPTVFDAQFVEALTWKLAAELAMPLASGMNLREHLLKIYFSILTSAWQSTAAEKREAVREETSYIDARS